MPHPEPHQGVSTGSHPVSTPSGCTNTLAVPVLGFEDVTAAILGWAIFECALSVLYRNASKKSLIL
jgi:hypothetical protein